MLYHSVPSGQPARRHPAGLQVLELEEHQLRALGSRERKTSSRGACQTSVGVPAAGLTAVSVATSTQSTHNLEPRVWRKITNYSLPR